jgi:hypothetical protein
VLLGLDEVTVDRLFAQCLARFEAMQTVYEDEAITIAPNQDGCLLSNFKHTLRDLLDGLWFERCAALDRHVDVPDRKFFSLHHGTSPKSAKENILSPRMDSVLPEIPEPTRRHFGVSNRVHDILVAHVVLEVSGINRWRVPMTFQMTADEGIG